MALGIISLVLGWPGIPEELCSVLLTLFLLLAGCAYGVFAADARCLPSHDGAGDGGGAGGSGGGGDKGKGAIGLEAVG